jgi:anti-sigma28 factor (negative regulator of flagellin synthesis)
MLWTRRHTLHALLTSASAVNLLSCSRAPSEPERSPPDSPQAGGLTIDQERMSAALQVTFIGTPWEAMAATLPQDLQSEIDALVAKGMVETATMVATMSNTFMLSAYELAATDTGDPVALGDVLYTGLNGLMTKKSDMAQQVLSSATELQAYNNGSDTVSADRMSEARAFFVTQEATMRAWLHEEGRSDEGYANTLLRVTATQRAETHTEQSIADRAAALEAAIQDLGHYDIDDHALWSQMLKDTSTPGGTPPPIDMSQFCSLLLIICLILTPFALGTSLAMAGSELEVLFELGLLFVGNYAALGNTYLLKQIHMNDPCNVMLVVAMVIMQMAIMLF